MEFDSMDGSILEDSALHHLIVPDTESTLLEGAFLIGSTLGTLLFPKSYIKQH
jgi:hypothetical protein